MNLLILKSLCSYYYEVVKYLKRTYNDNPEKSPIADFGVDQSKKKLFD